MDDLETNPFDVVELGKAFANKDIAVNLRSDDENDAAWLDGTGFRLIQPDNPILVQGGYWEVTESARAHAVTIQFGGTVTTAFNIFAVQIWLSKIDVSLYLGVFRYVSACFGIF